MNGMGLSQADAARRLNVSRSVVQRLWDHTQSEDSVSRRPVPGRPRATTPAEDRFQLFRHEGEEPLLCRSSLQTTFKHQEEESLLLRCEIVFHNAGLCKKTSCVRSSTDDSEANRLCWAREHVSWTQQQWASVLFTDESRFTMESDSGCLLI
ncbi:transposable element Tcb2 transposase [Trichonephila clavipes]|nr:transposable element Tcb2 transposase [Trichonephila clavipes]